MICQPCRNGQHPHDRHTGTIPGTRAGDDAGCPNLARPGDQGSECTCKVVVLAPASRKGRLHCPTCRCGVA